MDKTQIACLKALAEKATPGPWTLTGYGTIETLDGEETICHEVFVSNGDFIAAANPQAILELIAELETLKPHKEACSECGEVERDLRARIERLEKEADWLAEQLLDYATDAWDTVAEWRREARESVENQHD